MAKAPKGTQGGRAVLTGNSLEQFVLHTLEDRDYEYIPQKKFLAACILEQPLYTAQIFVGDSIYGRPLKVDFMLYHPEKWPNKLVIECKWQQGAGTADEKYPYTVLNIQNVYPCPAIILLAGAGFRSGAASWLRAQVDGEKLLHVFSMEEFQTWVNNDNLRSEEHTSELQSRQDLHSFPTRRSSDLRGQVRQTRNILTPSLTSKTCTLVRQSSYLLGRAFGLERLLGYARKWMVRNCCTSFRWKNFRLG